MKTSFYLRKLLPLSAASLLLATTAFAGVVSDSFLSPGDSFDGYTVMSTGMFRSVVTGAGVVSLATLSSTTPAISSTSTRGVVSVIPAKVVKLQHVVLSGSSGTHDLFPLPATIGGGVAVDHMPARVPIPGAIYEYPVYADDGVTVIGTGTGQVYRATTVSGTLQAVVKSILDIIPSPDTNAIAMIPTGVVLGGMAVDDNDPTGPLVNATQATNGIGGGANGLLTLNLDTMTFALPVFPKLTQAPGLDNNVFTKVQGVNYLPGGRIVFAANFGEVTPDENQGWTYAPKYGSSATAIGLWVVEPDGSIEPIAFPGQTITHQGIERTVKTVVRPAAAFLMQTRAFNQIGDAYIYNLTLNPVLGNPMAPLLVIRRTTFTDDGAEPAPDPDPTPSPK